MGEITEVHLTTSKKMDRKGAEETYATAQEVKTAEVR